MWGELTEIHECEEFPESQTSRPPARFWRHLRFDLRPGSGDEATLPRMKSSHVVRNYYVLPCCLLLLNLCVELVSYKARMIGDGFMRTGAIMAMVLFGASLVSFVVAPAIGVMVATLHRNSRQRAGGAGEMLFLLGLGVVIFWLYYRIYIVGPESVLPASWRNPVAK